MPGPEFFQTLMGRRFYEHDVPRIATALELIARALERSNASERKPDLVDTLTEQLAASPTAARNEGSWSAVSRRGSARFAHLARELRDRVGVDVVEPAADVIEELKLAAGVYATTRNEPGPNNPLAAALERLVEVARRVPR